jgi:hypothetical protein
MASTELERLAVGLSGFLFQAAVLFSVLCCGSLRVSCIFLLSRQKREN